MNEHILYADIHELHLSLERRSCAGARGRDIDPRACATALDAWIRAGELVPNSLAISTTTLHHGDFQPVIDVLCEHRPAVRFLRLGALTFPDFERGNDLGPREDSDGSSWIAEVRSLDRVLRALPALQELIVHANDIGLMDAEPICAPSLQRLVLRADTLAPDFIAALGQSTFSELLALQLWCGNIDYGWGDVTGKDLSALLDSSGMPKLRHLALLSDITNGLIPELAGSSVLPRLATLDLSYGTLGDEGAALLIEQWPRFAHLDRLMLAGNFMTPAAARALKGMAPRAIDIGWQRWNDSDGSKHCMPPAVSLFSDWPGP